MRNGWAVLVYCTLITFSSHLGRLGGGLDPFREMHFMNMVRLAPGRSIFYVAFDCIQLK